MLGAWIAWGLALAPDPTKGVPEEIQLSWRAPEACPDVEVVREHIVAQVAELEGPRRRVAAEAVVEATLVEDEAGFKLDLSVSTAGAVVLREVRSQDCALLARATGIIVGISVDAGLEVEGIVQAMDREAEAVGDEHSAAPEVVREEASSDPIDAVATPTKPARIDTTPSPRSDPPAIDAALRIAGGLDAGILPVGGGLDVSLAVTGRWWRAEGHASRWFSRRHEFDGEPGVGAELSLWSGGVRGCFVPAFGGVEVPVCVGGEVGQIDAEGFGGVVNFRADDLWVGVLLAPGVVWLPRPWIGLFGGVDGFVALRRPAFSGQDRPLLHRSSEVAIRALLGVEVRVGARATPR